MRLRTRRRKLDLTRSNVVSIQEIYDKYRETHPDMKIHKDQFSKVISTIIKAYREELLNGKALNLGNRLGLLYVRQAHNNFKNPFIDRVASAKIKMEHYGCESCEECYYVENQEIPYCRKSGLNIFGTVCYKNPDLMHSRKNKGGIKWVVPSVNKYYYHLMWQKRFSKLRNKKFYNIQSDTSFRNEIFLKKDKELIFNNR